MFLDSVSEQEYHWGDSWASIEVVRVARVRAERSRWAEDKGERSRETKPGTDGATGTGTDMPGQPSSVSQVHSHATGPGTQQAPPELRRAEWKGFLVALLPVCTGLGFFRRVSFWIQTVSHQIAGKLFSKS